MDTIALGLLIWSVIESKCIDESFYADKRVSDIFEVAEIKIMDWDKDNVFKIVLTCAEEATVICLAEEYEEHNVMVLNSHARLACYTMNKTGVASGSFS